MTEHYSKVFL